MSSAINENIVIEQGATFQREYTVTCPDDPNFTLTGSVVELVVKNSTGAVLATSAGTAIGTKVNVEFTDADTTLMPPSTGYTNSYRVKAKTPGGIAYRIAQGQAVIIAG